MLVLLKVVGAEMTDSFARIKRKKTVAVRVGSLTIGGDAPVAIQSMTNTRTDDVPSTLQQISRLVEAGCELVRVAVPDEKAARALSDLTDRSPVPLVADIHFDPALAFLAMENGAAKIRINPGNLGGRDKLAEVAREAQRRGVALRIGVNAGSLERAKKREHGGVGPRALVESALGYLETLDMLQFHQVVVSLKASDVYTTIEAYRLFSASRDMPLHLGVTGAGPREAGLIKNAVGIGALLAAGIGDTLRVSLTASPLEEVKAARQILQALGLRIFAPEVISCPTCGRCEVNLVDLVEKVEKILEDYRIPIRVAVMGCAVNGPGEAKEAHIGITAGKKHGMVFRRGEVVRTVPLHGLLEALKRELDLFAARHSANGGRGVEG